MEKHQEKGANVITPTKAWKTSIGNAYDKLDDAQEEEIIVLAGIDSKEVPEPIKSFARIIVAEKDKVIDILTTNAASRPRARKVNGGTKTRKTKEPPAQVTT